MPEDILFVLRKYDMIATYGAASAHARPSMSSHPSATVVHSLGHAPIMPEADKVEQAMQIPFSYDIRPDYAAIDVYLAKLEAKGWLKLDPAQLNWSPYILNRSGVLKKKVERPDPAQMDGSAGPAGSAPAAVADASHVAPAALVPVDPSAPAPTGGAAEHTITSLANATNPGFHSQHAGNYEEMQVDPPADGAQPPADAPPQPPADSAAEPMAVDLPSSPKVNGGDPSRPRVTPPATKVIPPTRAGSPSPRQKRASAARSPAERSLSAQKRRRAGSEERRRVEDEERASLALIADMQRSDRGLRSTATPSPTISRATRTPVGSVHKAHSTAAAATASGGGRSTRGSAGAASSPAKPPPLPDFGRVSHQE